MDLPPQEHARRRTLLQYQSIAIRKLFKGYDQGDDNKIASAKQDLVRYMSELDGFGYEYPLFWRNIDKVGAFRLPQPLRISTEYPSP